MDGIQGQNGQTGKWKTKVREREREDGGRREKEIIVVFFSRA